MSRRSPFEVRLLPDDRAVLEEQASSRTAAHAEAVRACIVLLAAEVRRTWTSPLAERVMTLEPYARSRRGYWVVDNGSSHRGQRSVERIHAAWPNAQLVYLPVHASWLNQIEIVFSVIQRKVIKPADFADLAALADRLCRFEERYNATARPFDWRLTSRDLAAMLERLDAHGPEADLPLGA